jgi:uncharacterized protein (TIGR03083 family)
MTTAIDVRDAFTEATAWYLGVIDAIAPDQWERPGLGVWNVRELVGHSLRSFTTIEEYTAGGGGVAITVGTAVGYYESIFSNDRAALHASVAQRGKDSGVKLGPDPVAAIHEAAARVLGLIDQLPDDRPCASPFGVLRLSSYLQTRLVELVVHGMDICRSIGHPLDAPEAAARLALEPLVTFSDPRRVLLAITGREVYDLFA